MSRVGGDPRSADRLPWEVVETFPRSDADELARHDAIAAQATDPATRSRALVRAALLRYWAPTLGAVDEPAAEATRRREADTAEALEIARNAGDPDLLATALLGRLYACWGPPKPDERRSLLDELAAVRPDVAEAELRLRAIEWEVLDRFDAGDVDGVHRLIDAYVSESDRRDHPLLARREILWRSNLAMLEGRVDEAVRMNEDAIASTADLAGSPFSFQNVAITMAIAGYLRRELGDLVDAVRSILASSPRVEVNWQVGLTFSLSEVGESDEARARFARLAENGFAAVPRDLNWLVCVQLLGLIAVNLGDRSQAAVLRTLLEPYRALDATHGSGYASYGPIARTLGQLAALDGDRDDARRCFDEVLHQRPAGPWTTLARADRALLTATDDPDLALADAERAEAELRTFGLNARAREMRELATRIRVDGTGGPIAHLERDHWTLSHPSGRATLADGVGMRHLVELLRRPGDQLDVLDLDAPSDPSLLRTSTIESTLDDAARRAYRRRLDDLEARAELDDAGEAEIAFLRRELATAVHARPSSSELERARIRVTTAIRRAIDSIDDAAPGLAEHLRATITTGRRCSYQPIDGQGWRIER